MTLHGRVIGTLDDGEELTLIVREEEIVEMVEGQPDAAVEAGYCLVKLQATLPWDTVGYAAAVALALAGAHVSAGFLAGYSTDYLLVRQRDLAAATDALARLVAEAQRQIA
jgi:hypothetical protein